MIKNEKQYKITKAKIKGLVQSISVAERAIGRDPDAFLALERDALRSQASDLRREVAEYEDLKAGNAPMPEFTNIRDLPKTLIKSRIALGLSQKDLAERTGLQEQQIQRYEHSDYESASYSRLREISDALSLEREKIESSSPPSNIG